MGSQKVIERISSITKSAKGQKECIQSENTNKRGFEMNDQITKDNFEQEIFCELRGLLKEHAQFPAMWNTDDRLKEWLKKETGENISDLILQMRKMKEIEEKGGQTK